MSLSSTFDARFLPLSELQLLHPTDAVAVTSFQPPTLPSPISEVLRGYLHTHHLPRDKTVAKINHLLSAISAKVKKLLLNEQGEVAQNIEVDGVREIAFYGAHGDDSVDLHEYEYDFYKMALRGPSASHVDTVQYFLYRFPTYDIPASAKPTRSFHREAFSMLRHPASTRE